jgi:hypothetical protein
MSEYFQTLTSLTSAESMLLEAQQVKQTKKATESHMSKKLID